MNDLDWIKDITESLELNTNESYFMDFSDTPFDEDVIRNKIYELVGSDWEQYSNRHVNWFNNPNISGVDHKCILSFHIHKQRPYIQTAWELSEYIDEFRRRDTELTLETFLNSKV